MKLKERDNRPKHQFKFGDIADVSYQRQIIPNAVVVEAKEIRGPRWQTVPTQTCKVIIAPREVDLHATLRRLIARREQISNPDIQGYEVCNTRMVFKGSVPPEWIACVTSQDISNIRFEAILDD